MISTISQDKVFNFVGLSTGEKPLSFNGVKVGNGSLFEEIDTSNKFLFDAENDLWINQQNIYAHNLSIQASSNTTINGFQVPDLTTEQVTTAYNTVVAGNNVVICDATGMYHMTVNQADCLNNLLTIEMMYFSTMLLIYTINENDIVEISYKEI